MPEYWGNYESDRATEVPISPLLAYVGREFVDGRKPNSSKIKRHLYSVACASYCVVWWMMILDRVFPPRELIIQDLPGHFARMQVAAFDGVLFLLSQYVHDFVRGIKMQDLVEQT